MHVVKTKTSVQMLNINVIRFQNPRDADPMTKVQSELDETKVILVSTMRIIVCSAVMVTAACKPQ